LYQRTATDKINHLKRCQFEAAQGLASVALDRLCDLAEEFPGDADILHVEGRVRKEILGQGVKAYALVTQAFERDQSFANAHNAAMLAPSEQEFRKWSDIALRIAPLEHEFKEHVESVRSTLNTGVPYWKIRAAEGSGMVQAKGYGPGAAILELALLGDGIGSEREPEIRRGRAKALRALDATACSLREGCGEVVPPEERLALQEALHELEKTLTLDPYDPELWNLKSAWCTLKQRYEDAIQSADRAIQLRPVHYPKPHLNKAAALRRLGRFDESLACAREGLAQASNGDPADLDLARQSIEESAKSPKKLTNELIESILNRISQAALETAGKELGQQGDSVRRMAADIANRALQLRSDRSAAFVPLVAELLSDFTPDAVCAILLEAKQRHPNIASHCLDAALYVAAHSEAVRRRDAARLLSLTIITASTIAEVRTTYRRTILEPSAAATDALGRLDVIMRRELGAIHPSLPEAIADQEPIDDEGRTRCARGVLSRLEMPGNASESPSMIGGSTVRHYHVCFKCRRILGYTEAMGGSPLVPRPGLQPWCNHCQRPADTIEEGKLQMDAMGNPVVPRLPALVKLCIVVGIVMWFVVVIYKLLSRK
jgi:tetratricopeptide (TPR) repeat protein